MEGHDWYYTMCSKIMFRNLKLLDLRGDVMFWFRVSTYLNRVRKYLHPVRYPIRQAGGFLPVESVYIWPITYTFVDLAAITTTEVRAQTDKHQRWAVFYTCSFILLVFFFPGRSRVNRR